MNAIPTPAIRRSVLLDALSGADVCHVCRGSGKLYVALERTPRPCPMCRGRGLRDRA